MTSKAIKLDDQTYCRLQHLAEAKRRTPHWLMREAIRQFLDREETAAKIKQETLDRWARFEATGEAVGHEAVATWLETWGTELEGPCPV